MKMLLAFLLCAPLWANFQKVDLNTASKEQLALLPGIGEKMAKRIADERSKQRGFVSVDDLAKIDGMRPKMFEQIREHVFVSRRVAGKSDIKPTQNAPAVPAAISTEQVQIVMQQFSHEPSCQLVQDMATTFMHAHPDRVASWFARARTAPWLPQIKADVDRNLDQGQSLRQKVGDADTLYVKNTADWLFGVAVEWRLGELVFNANELHTAREAIRVAEAREKVLAQVTQIYFERRKLQVTQKLLPSGSIEEELQRVVKMQELTSHLDALTGGAFSGALRDAST